MYISPWVVREDVFEDSSCSDVEGLWSTVSTNRLLVNIKIAYKQCFYRLHINVALDFYI